MALNTDRFSSRVAGACREPAEGSALEPPGPRTGCGAGGGPPGSSFPPRNWRICEPVLFKMTSLNQVFNLSESGTRISLLTCQFRKWHVTCASVPFI